EDVEGIAREKAAIFAGLRAGGTAIYNADVETAPILGVAAERAGQSVAFGTRDAADWCAAKVSVSANTTEVQLQSPLGPLAFGLATDGGHFGLNAVAALAAVDALGADAKRAACDLSDWRPQAGRGQREEIQLRLTSGLARIDLIDDAYNANPASLGAALDVLGAIETTRRRVAVLGDMLELGPTSEDLHKAMVDHPAMSRIALVHTAGPLMRSLHGVLPSRQKGRWAENASALAAEASDLIANGDIVLVKGSKGSRISLFVDAMRKLGHPLPEDESEV
ncbi:MAG: Mur ligase family protein, partial [Pseudomonadota bacterium]